MITRRILLLQSDQSAAKQLFVYFKKRGDQVWASKNVNQTEELLKRHKPDLVFLDLHLPGESWFEALALVQEILPSAKLILTNQYPDLHRELLAKERGIRVFLRQPFTPSWIEKAIRNSETTMSLSGKRAGTLPRVKVSMGVKITFPYALLAAIFALTATYLVSRFVFESMRDRFMVQLIDTGKLSSDWMVQEEDRLLETLRLLANTEGVAEAVQGNDAERLRVLALPVAINYEVEAIDILTQSGVSLLSLHHPDGAGRQEYLATKGDTSFAAQGFIQNVLLGKVDQQGDKFAGLARVPWGDYFYIAGPVRDTEGRITGAVAIGKSITSLTRQIRQDTLAHVSVYALDGSMIDSTIFIKGNKHPLPLDMVMKVLMGQDEESSIRDMTIAGGNYTEILGPWEARGGLDLGIVGTSLAQNFIARPSLMTRFQVIAVVLLAVLGVILLGIYLAHQITSPLSRVVQASIEIAKGNLEVKVPSQGNDEIMVLAHAFNYMVSGLQEGFIYRDLLGRTVSPQVREALRHSFASGDIRLEGQNATATVMMSDIRNFTSMAEKEEPTTILKWLNEYFGALVPVVTSHGGVVDKFEGDAMLAFFGILPQPLFAEESAYQSCKAALKLLEVIDHLNTSRKARGEPPLVTGIGINTGLLIAGGLGTSDRLNYTIIGDAVNTTQRIEGVTRTFGESGIVISESTLAALKEHRGEFNFEPLGEHALKGKSELIWLYRLYGEGEHEDQVVLSENDLVAEIYEPSAQV